MGQRPTPRLHQATGTVRDPATSNAATSDPEDSAPADLPPRQSLEDRLLYNLLTQIQTNRHLQGAAHAN